MSGKIFDENQQKQRSSENAMPVNEHKNWSAMQQTAEMDLRIAENDRQFFEFSRETNRKFAEFGQQLAENDHEIAEYGRQLLRNGQEIAEVLRELAKIERKITKLSNKYE